MKLPKFLSHFLYLAAIVFSLGLLFFVIAAVWISYEVRHNCQESQKIYPGSCVDSLVSLINDPSQTFDRRNSAVWSLGQLGDSTALPHLQKLYTGQIPAREPWNEVLSQYELKKAINLTQGGFNLSAFLWRSFN